MDEPPFQAADAPPCPSWCASDAVIIPLDPSPFTNNPFPVQPVRSLFQPATAHECTTNARLKKYPTKATLQVANSDVFPACHYESYDDFRDGKPRKFERPYSVPKKGQAADPGRSLEESQRRAKTKVCDIALCNQFTHFFTWTLDPALIDRYDAQAIYKKLRAFLSNVSQRKGFSYVVIPEYHKQKEGEAKPAIHMHGLCSLGTVKISRAYAPDGTPIQDGNGRDVYNMDDWKLGFSTCVELDGDYEKAVSYVTKYITKSEEKIFGKWYLSSRALTKAPDIIPLDRINFDQFVEPSKVQDKTQYITNIYRDVQMCSEEYEL